MQITFQANISKQINPKYKTLCSKENTVAVLDFIISSIGKIQKGQRLALGLDVEEYEDTSPVINIIEGVNEEKI